MGWFKMTTTQSTVRKAVLFAASILFVAGLLSLLNWIPLIIQKQKLKSFSSPDAAAKELHVRKIYLPSYLPEHLNLAWPPSEVYGQDVPFSAVVMYLSFKQRPEIGLALHQSDAQASYMIEPRIKIRPGKTSSQISLKGRRATLVPAICDDNTPCNQLSWDEHGTIITLIGKFSAQDIIKIASSMIPDA
jgi:hypothetical protein